MKNGSLIILAAAALAACTPAPPPVPDSGIGVGFGDYADFELDRARREAQLTGQPIGGPLSATRPPVTTAGPNPNAVIPTSELAAAGIGTSAASTALRP